MAPIAGRAHSHVPFEAISLCLIYSEARPSAPCEASPVQDTLLRDAPSLEPLIRQVQEPITGWLPQKRNSESLLLALRRSGGLTQLTKERKTWRKLLIGCLAFKSGNRTSLRCCDERLVEDESCRDKKN